MNNFQHPLGSSCQFDEEIQSISSQIRIRSFSESIHLIHHYKLKYLPMFSHHLNKNIYELNKVLIFEETPRAPDASIPVVSLELSLYLTIFLTLILFEVPENTKE